MIVLGLTTSGPVEAAITGGARPVATAGAGQALSSLLDCVTSLLGELESPLSDVAAIAVCTGPGSFTGLRIGVAFAKALAQARDLPCIGVSAYDVAEAGSRALFPRAAILTGKRGFYYARLRASADGPSSFVCGESLAISDVVAQLARDSGRPVMLHGETGAVADRRSAIAAGSFAARRPGELALAVAQLGAARLSAGEAADWRTIAIDYGQRPNAELNWEARRART